MAMRVVDGPPGGRFLTGTEAQKYLGVGRDVWAELVADNAHWLRRTVKPAGRYHWEDVFALAVILRGMSQRQGSRERESD